MCQGAKLHRCWLGTSCDGPLTAERVAAAVFQEIEGLTNFDDAFIEVVTAESKRLDGDRAEQIARLSAEQQKTVREIDNVMAFIRGGNSSARGEPRKIPEIDELGRSGIDLCKSMHGLVQG
jgi:hypothetical protein